MKLYTEFEVKFAMDVARCQPNRTFDEVLEELTPIELPTDDEIENYARQWALVHEFITRGAKWMRNKNQGGEDETQ